jgi:hypothetical protein
MSSYNTIENYAPLYGFRTAFDVAMQATWCNNCRCGACQVDYEHDESGPAGHHEPDCQHGPEYFTLPFGYKSNCSPPMQSGNLPRNLIKYNAMQAPQHKMK